MFKITLKPYEKYRDSGVEWIGEISEHWEVRKLKYIAKVYNGSTPSTSNSLFWDGDITWVTPVDISRNSTINTSNRNITKKGLLSCGTTLVPKNSIILTTRAPVGNIAIAGVELCTNQGCKAIVVNRNIIFYNFLYYLFSTTKEIFNSLSSGSTFVEFSTTQLTKFNILLPPLQEQQKIANYLNRKTKQADTFIEKQTRIIELLKEQKKAIINQAVTKGLNPDAPMKDSGIEWLGEIPGHWEVRKLKHLSVNGFKNGIFKKNEKFGKGTKIINVLDVYQNDFLVDFDKLDRVEANNKEIERYLVSVGDIFFVRSSLKLEGTGVSACIINRNRNEPTIFECHVVKMSPNKKIILPIFLINYLNSIIVRQRLISLTQMVTMSTISQPKLSSIEVALPRKEEQHQIVTHIETKTAKIDQAIEKAEKEIILVKEYLQSLIYQVVTGRLKL
ncbi:restriction endonuclease subunit S [Desulfococcaceae bacterium HSG9]|nr:restriction endonuclease subunit S [Desulfococcaceae bacterium HSG9]